MATVVLPRSLAALFPAAGRHVEVQGTTVLEVLAALEDAVPGVRDRILEAGPSIRTHLNLYVDGERAGLATPVGPRAVVHVIPAVSGG